MSFIVCGQALVGGHVVGRGGWAGHRSRAFQAGHFVMLAPGRDEAERFSAMLRDGSPPMASSSSGQLDQILECPTASRIRPRPSLAPGAFFYPRSLPPAQAMAIAPIRAIRALRYGKCRWWAAPMSLVAPFVRHAMFFVDGGVVGRWRVRPVEAGGRGRAGRRRQNGRTGHGAAPLESSGPARSHPGRPRCPPLWRRRSHRIEEISPCSFRPVSPPPWLPSP